MLIVSSVMHKSYVLAELFPLAHHCTDVWARQGNATWVQFLADSFALTCKKVLSHPLKIPPADTDFKLVSVMKLV